MEWTRRILVGVGVVLAVPVVVALALLAAVLYYVYVVLMALRFLLRGLGSALRRLVTLRPGARDLPVTLALPPRQ